jgi:hypothetical protein
VRVSFNDLPCCQACDQPFALANSCRPDAWSSIPYGQETVEEREQPGDLPSRPLPRCRACYVNLGGYHHPPCTVAQCGTHGGQQFSCAACTADKEAMDLDDESVHLLARGLTPDAADLLSELDYRANPDGGV